MTLRIAAALLLAVTSAPAQQTPAQILATPSVQAAMKVIEASEPHFIDEQVRLCEIAAPPFHEDKRAAELARLFTAAGLANVRIDKAGNVLGDRPGTAPHPHLVLAAHLDTVFPGRPTSRSPAKAPCSKAQASATTAGASPRCSPSSTR